MTILYVQKRPSRAGAQTCLARLVACREVAALNPVVLVSSEGWLSDECRRIGVRCIVERFPTSRSISGRLWGNRSFARRVADRLQCEGLVPRLVHANDHLEGLIGQELSEALSVPSVITLRSSGMTAKDVRKYRCGDYNAITAVGETIRDRASQWLGSTRVVHVHDGLAESEFSLPLQYSEQPPGHVLVIGSTAVPKGWVDVAEAVALLEKSGGLAPTQYDFTGDRPDPKTNDLGLHRFRDGQFRFLGHREGFAALVRDYDLVIHPSRQETFGMAAVETLAAGVPLLSTRVGVLGDVLEGSGMLVPPHDPQALARALSDLYVRWNAFRDDGFGVETAQARLRQSYTMDQTARAYIDVYKSVVPDIV